MKDFFKYVLATVVGILIASVVSTLLGVAILVGVAASSEQATQVKDKSLLYLNLKGVIVERKVDDPLEDLPIFEDQAKEIGLNQILANVAKAEKDPKIKGIFLQTGTVSTGLASMEEIRNALQRFKDSGKFIVAYSGTYSQAGYYMASVADELYVNPQGIIDIRGFSSERMFYKKFLEKFGIEATIIRVGTYKSAVEPFLNEKMSEASKEQTSVMLGAFWKNYTEAISSARDLSVKDVNAYAAEVTAFLKQEKYLEYNLADGLKYYDEVENILRDKLGLEEEKKINMVSLKEYATAEVEDEALKGVKDKVAVIYAYGGIDTGDSDGINSSKLVKTIEKVRKNKKVKAVVLRVNSPGGSAYGSEQIWRFMGNLKEEKPVVVSMGDYAASGGYYIACNADTIIADKNTLTGSIGIFGVLMNFNGTAEKIGVGFDRVKTHNFSDVMSGTRSVTAEEKAMMQKWINRGYDNFVTRCAEGRNMKWEEIDKIGGGRVWAANHAKENGLVDAYGDLQKAIEIAGNMAGLEKYKVAYYPKEKSFIEKLMADMQGSAQKLMVKLFVGDDFNAIETVEKLKENQGMQARMPYDIRIN